MILITRLSLQILSPLVSIVVRLWLMQPSSSRQILALAASVTIPQNVRVPSILSGLPFNTGALPMKLFLNTSKAPSIPVAIAPTRRRPLAGSCMIGTLVVCLATTDPRLSHAQLGHRSHLSLHNPLLLCSGLGGRVDRWTHLT
jgi:hypothetical protein